MSVPLVAAGRVTLDGSGNGTVRVGPAGNRSWTVNRLTVAGNSATVPKAFVYVGEPVGSPADSTYLGDGAASEVNDLNVPAGLYLTCVFQGGTPGAVHTFQPYGDENPY